MKDQNFKIVDKLLCKKDYINELVSFHYGIEYVITDMLLNAWIVIENEERFYYLKDDNGNKIELRHEIDLNEYFCNKQDIRNMKLKKIHEES